MMALRVILSIFTLLRLPAAVVVAVVLAAAVAPAEAQTRRAFVVGNGKYGDPAIQRLERAGRDAKDIAADLEGLGFDKKNVKLVSDIGSREDFVKAFGEFLKTVQAGDDVLFYYSGHGYGVRTGSVNYLLFGNVKSALTFTRAKLPAAEAKDASIVRSRLDAYVPAYEEAEIPRAGISEAEIRSMIAAKKPRSTILIVDACRSLLGLNSDSSRQPGGGEGLIAPTAAEPGVFVIHSAQFGEDAVEQLDRNDQRSNSLFTEILREGLRRPGADIRSLAEEVARKVSLVAKAHGVEQNPEFVDGLSEPFLLAGSSGAERNALVFDRCRFAGDAWAEITDRKTREVLDRYLEDFGGCDYAEDARQDLANLAQGAVETLGVEDRAVREDASVDDCDRLAASDFDSLRPSNVKGVPFDRIDAEPAVRACERAIADNPRVVRYLFNLGRALQRQAQLLPSSDPGRRDLMEKAFRRQSDARSRGYVPAFNNVALMYESGDGAPQKDPKQAIALFRQAAQQGLPIAMVNLAQRLATGVDGILDRNTNQAYEWYAKASEAGNVEAKLQAGRFLYLGWAGGNRHPRRAAEHLTSAADSGSILAKRWLGELYYWGGIHFDANRGKIDDARSVPADKSLALLWFGRAAEGGDPFSQASMAQILEQGDGVPSPQPAIAERYWRLAARNGSVLAQVELADRIRTNRVLVKPENNTFEIVNLLERAVSRGSARAALTLARLYRGNELGIETDRTAAVRFAYKAIELAGSADPTTAESTPYYEVAAGILIVEMGRNGEAVGADGRSLVDPDELARLETYYGTVDPVDKKVKAVRLLVPVTCGYVSRNEPIWIWDWGRKESPTELQFRAMALRRNSCRPDEVLRGAFVKIYEQVAKSREPAEKGKTPARLSFPDLVVKKIEVAKASVEGDNRRR